MGILRLTHRAFEVFIHLVLDLALFVQQRVFPKCGQVLVSESCGVEPKLAKPDSRSLDPIEVWGSPSHSVCLDFLSDQAGISVHWSRGHEPDTQMTEP
jgi:hypothetical protein